MNWHRLLCHNDGAINIDLGISVNTRWPILGAKPLMFHLYRLPPTTQSTKWLGKTTPIHSLRCGLRQRLI